MAVASMRLGVWSWTPNWMSEWERKVI